MVEKIRNIQPDSLWSINGLVISPTRELSHQINKEARTLLTGHPHMGTLCFFGGTNVKSDQKALENEKCDILVVTPGRMQDHIDNTKGFVERLQQLKFLVLDEADQLLDMGFRDAILKIMRSLPSKER